MTQAERDRLVALKKAKKKLITQRQAAEEIGVTERQVRRLLRKLRRKGDRAVIHELRGRASNRKLPAEMEERAMTVLSDPVYDATSRLFARFVRHDSSEENMRLLWSYLERFGRPLAFYTDKAGMFQSAVKTKRQEQREGRDRPEMPPTQIARALRELGIVWIPAHSPQAKGRVERQFLTAQDRLVKGMRVACVCTMEEADAYLEKEYLPWWNQALTVKPADAADAHRPLGQESDLAAILSHVEQRQVTNDYTLRYCGKIFQIDRQDIGVGMRKARVRVEERLDGTIAVRFQDTYVRVRRCEQSGCQPPPSAETRAVPPLHSTSKAKRKSQWMKNFSVRSGPSLREAIEVSNARS